MESWFDEDQDVIAKRCRTSHKKCEEVGIKCDKLRNRIHEEVEDLITDKAKRKADVEKIRARESLLEIEFQKVRKELKNLDSELAEVKHENAEQEFLKENLEKECEKQCRVLGKEDELSLEKCHKKYELYKSITGIRWDFACEKIVIQGFIKNAVKDYVHPFSYKESNSDCLWSEIAAAAHHDWSDAD